MPLYHPCDYSPIEVVMFSCNCWLDSKFHLPYIQILKAEVELDSRTTIFGWSVLNDSDPFSVSLSVVLSNEARSIEHFRLSKIEFWLFGDLWAKVEQFYFRDLAKVNAVAKSTKHSNYSEVLYIAFSILPSTPPFGAHPHPLNRTSHVLIYIYIYKRNYFPLRTGIGIHPKTFHLYTQKGCVCFSYNPPRFH